MVPHLICGGLTAEQIEFQLQDFKFMGISNILALREDCLTGEKRFSPVPGGYDHANELVEAISGIISSAPSEQLSPNDSGEQCWTER